jgi:hypothetical protein
MDILRALDNPRIRAKVVRAVRGVV